MEIAAKQYSGLTLDELYRILQMRSSVFMLEQRIICMDMDEVDKRAVHFMGIVEGYIIAYLRLYHEDGCIKIGRVLTLKEHRGQGHGKMLMDAAVAYAQRAFPGLPIKLHSQCQVIAFYESCGFKVCSDEFLEEGVRHREMLYDGTN